MRRGALLLTIALVAGFAGAVAAPAVDSDRADTGVICGLRVLDGRLLRIRLTGGPMSCAHAVRIARRPCEGGRRWACFAARPPYPLMVWVRARELFKRHPSVVMEVLRTPCSDTPPVSRWAWRQAGHGDDTRTPTALQVLADDLVRCHQLDKSTLRHARGLLGKPAYDDWEDGYRYLAYPVGGQRDSLFVIDGEMLGLRFRHGRLDSIGFFST